MYLPCSVELKISIGNLWLATGPLNATRLWPYKPAQLSGKPVEAQIEIIVKIPTDKGVTRLLEERRKDTIVHRVQPGEVLCPTNQGDGSELNQRRCKLTGGIEYE